MKSTLIALMGIALLSLTGCIETEDDREERRAEERRRIQIRVDAEQRGRSERNAQELVYKAQRDAADRQLKQTLEAMRVAAQKAADLARIKSEEAMAAAGRVHKEALDKMAQLHAQVMRDKTYGFLKPVIKSTVFVLCLSLLTFYISRRGFNHREAVMQAQNNRALLAHMGEFEPETRAMIARALLPPARVVNDDDEDEPIDVNAREAA